MAGYQVKEIFLTLQGEGAQTGRTAVFCRFVGCNLWSGRPIDRSRAVCRFCDTDFHRPDGVLGGHYGSALTLSAAIASLWHGSERRYVVLTGGEPLLQLDRALIDALHDECFAVAVETNGTLPAPGGIDWLCVSPKGGAELVQRHGDELKLVYPQAQAAPEDFADLAFSRFSLQPMDGPDREANTKSAIAYCLLHPQWQLSVQIHKTIGIR
ncbi:MAG: 7-carboxy-7-deazaguanine synthase [Alphaproteobacteria bacterium]|nr:7-carboxy-7-deazaguanine synthase [Alphaproteobacteria bacterium]